MGAFEYTALDAGGTRTQGGHRGRHREARARSCCASASCCRSPSARSRRRRPGASARFTLHRAASPPADLSLLTRQLATLVRAGLPLEEALLAVSQQSEKPRVQSILLGVRAKVMEGHTLASGLADFPRVFPEIYRATVSGGRAVGPSRPHSRTAGRLHREPRAAAAEGHRRAALSHRAVGHVLRDRVDMLVYVVPKVVEVFDSNARKLPLMTQRADRGQRLPAAQRPLAAHRHRDRRASSCWRALTQAGRPPALPPAAAAAAAGRPAGARLQHGALHAHVQHPHRQRRAGARCAAHRRRSRDQPADARRRGRGRRSACARARRSAGRSRAQPAVPAHDRAPDLAAANRAASSRTCSSAPRQPGARAGRLLAALVGLLGPLMIVTMGMFVMGIVFAMLLPIFEMNSLIA